METVTEKMDRKRINLIDSIKSIEKPSYWLFMLPNWAEFGTHLSIGTLIGASFYLTINLFILSGTFLATIASFQQGDRLINNTIKINLMLGFFVCALGHVWYLCQQAKIQLYLKSFKKLESKVEAMGTCQGQDSVVGRKGFTVITVFFSLLLINRRLIVLDAIQCAIQVSDWWLDDATIHIGAVFRHSNG